MDKLSEDKTPIEQPYIYKVPTHDELVDSVMSKGPFIGRCKLCKKTLKALSIEEFTNHKCNG